MNLSKRRFGRIAVFHSKNLLGEARKNLKKSLGKSIQTKKLYQFILGKTLQERPMKAAWFDALLFDPRFGGPKLPILWRHFGTRLETTSSEAPKSEPGKAAACRQVSR